MISGFAEVAARLADLRGALGAIPEPSDRRIALDAVRDALDRGAEPAAGAEIVAGGYARECLLHEGPLFEVHLLRQRDAGTLHALKTPCGDRASDPLLRRLILDEAAHQGRVAHPACLAFRALLRLPDGRPALLTDHVEAPTLQAILDQGPLDAEAALALARRLGEALAAVHTAGIVHGDVKPGNVFLPGGKPEAAVLFDFGLARPIGAPWRREDVERAQTPRFAGPGRQEPDALAGPADDLWSLGRLLGVACSTPSFALSALVAALTSPEPANGLRSACEIDGFLGDCGTDDTT
ncbi:hypothetical protein [Aureimonas sp. ME7]|uniref:protein kinase domain-containing protein n=1 Tax=Aureimonas sp. ME7 TaxID=2744252 RepID=UPI0015F410FD|nr:hypothetical protein [Aureimonas sp. ME7]